MNRNQKIALGCGAGGCLGLILLVICIAVLIVTGIIKAPGLYDPGPRENHNRNSNYNSNYNANTNNNSNSDSSDSSSLSNDAQHKLFQAASATQDQALMRRVWIKLGLMKSSGALDDSYAPFVKEHISWIFKNTDFLQTVNTPEKGRAYVDEHIDD